jgi:hypothetical protein
MLLFTLERKLFVAESHIDGSYDVVACFNQLLTFSAAVAACCFEQ